MEAATMNDAQRWGEHLRRWWVGCDDCGAGREATDVVTSRSLVGGGTWTNSERQACPRHAAAAARRSNAVDRRAADATPYEPTEGEPMHRARVREPLPTPEEATAAVEAADARIAAMDSGDRIRYTDTRKRMALAARLALEARS